MATGTTTQTGPTISMSIKSGEGAFAPFERVKLHSDGTATHAGAGDVGIGSVAEGYNPTTDTYLGVVLDHLCGTQKAIAAGVIAAGGAVYGAASGKVSATTTGPMIGIVTSASSAAASGDHVEFIPLGKLSSNWRSIAAGTALTNTTTETSLGAATIPANRLRAGSRVRIRVQVIATATNSTDTLNIKAYLGSIASGLLIAATGAVNVADNDIGYIEGELVVRTTTTAVACGVTALGVEGTVTAKPFKMASGTVDLTVANDVTISGTWSVASASNSCRLDVLNVDVID